MYFKLIYIIKYIGLFIFLLLFHISCKKATFNLLQDTSPVSLIAKAELKLDEAHLDEEIPFEIKLTSQPFSDVTLELASEYGYIEITPNKLIFSHHNWKTTQTFIIQVKDNISVNQYGYDILKFNPMQSEDADYNGMDLEDLQIQIQDDELDINWSVVPFESDENVDYKSINENSTMPIVFEVHLNDDLSKYNLNTINLSFIEDTTEPYFNKLQYNIDGRDNYEPIDSTTQVEFTSNQNQYLYILPINNEQDENERTHSLQIQLGGQEAKNVGTIKVIDDDDIQLMISSPEPSIITEGSAYPLTLSLNKTPQNSTNFSINIASSIDIASYINNDTRILNNNNEPNQVNFTLNSIDPTTITIPTKPTCNIQELDAIITLTIQKTSGESDVTIPTHTFTLNSSLYAGGMGSNSYPYLITTTPQLNNIRHCPDQHFKLSNSSNSITLLEDPITLDACNTAGGNWDMDMETCTRALNQAECSYLGGNWDTTGSTPTCTTLEESISTQEIPVLNTEQHTSWQPIGTKERPFTGTLNGDGHTISNLYIHGDYLHAGLFGYTNGATIKNLTIDTGSVYTTGQQNASYAGALIGYAENTTIENITIDNINVTSNNTFNSTTGGLIGLGENMHIKSSSNIKSSSTSGGITSYSGSGNSIAGGIAGSLLNSILEQSSSTNTIFSYANSTLNSSYAGGLIGIAYDSRLDNNYTTGSIEAKGNPPITDSSCTTAKGSWDTTGSTPKCTRALNPPTTETACNAVDGSWDKTGPTCTRDVNKEAECRYLGGNWDTTGSTPKCTRALNPPTTQDECTTAKGSWDMDTCTRALNQAECRYLNGNWDTTEETCTTNTIVNNIKAYAGGLVASLTGGRIMNSYSTGSIKIQSKNVYAGGLIGEIINDRNTGIVNSFSTRTINNPRTPSINQAFIGGLIGKESNAGLDTNITHSSVYYSKAEALTRNGVPIVNIPIVDIPSVDIVDINNYHLGTNTDKDPFGEFITNNTIESSERVFQSTTLWYNNTVYTLNLITTLATETSCKKADGIWVNGKCTRALNQAECGYLSGIWDMDTNTCMRAFNPPTTADACNTAGGNWDMGTCTIALNPPTTQQECDDADGSWDMGTCTIALNPPTTATDCTTAGGNWDMGTCTIALNPPTTATDCTTARRSWDDSMDTCTRALNQAECSYLNGTWDYTNSTCNETTGTPVTTWDFTDNTGIWQISGSNYPTFR